MGSYQRLAEKESLCPPKVWRSLTICTLEWPKVRIYSFTPSRMSMEDSVWLHQMRHKQTWFDQPGLRPIYFRVVAYTRMVLGAIKEWAEDTIPQRWWTAHSLPFCCWRSSWPEWPSFHHLPSLCHLLNCHYNKLHDFKTYWSLRWVSVATLI